MTTQRVADIAGFSIGAVYQYFPNKEGLVEALALREKVGMIDLAPFVVFDVSGPAALDYLQHLTVNNCNVAVGRSVYTPLLDPLGGFRTDLTIMRLADDAFRVVTGAFASTRSVAPATAKGSANRNCPITQCQDQLRQARFPFARRRNGNRNGVSIPMT